MNNLREIAQKFNISEEFAVYENVEMARRFSFKVGGRTPLLIEPLTENALLKALNTLEAEKIPYFILGGGTNIVFSDTGYDGVVISTVKLNNIEEMPLNESKSSGDQVVLKCQCGTLMNTVVNFAVKNSLTGLEEFCGLPGTCGGAGYMNARCFNREISDVVGTITYFDKIPGKKDVSGGISEIPQFVRKTLEYDKTMWSYKISPFTGTDKVISSVEFRVKKTTDSGIQQRAASFMKERVEKGHFKFPCAGSVFKNNHAFGKPTGQIVDELGLKGQTIGGAQIAPWHGNIIINRDNATSKDIKALVEFVKEQVKSKTGFDLEEEILFY